MGLFAKAASKSRSVRVAEPAMPPDPGPVTASAGELQRAAAAPWSLAPELESAADLLWAHVREQAVRRGRRCIFISHWAPGEGATTVAAAMAARAAELNGQAGFCLGDFDFFRAGLTSLVGLDSAAGISDLTDGAAPLDMVLATTRWENLAVLPAGQPPLGEQAARHFHVCRRMVEQLSLEFDWLFIDAPALRDYQNCSLWAGELAVSVLVVRAGEARKQAVAKAVRTLQLMDLPPVAIALNRRRYYIPQWLYKRT